MNPSTGTDDVLLHGEVKASYFWDDGSGINGDTGMPASGEPMQEGLFAAPSWPLGTKGYVVYNGKKADFFIGDRGPGNPSNDCHVMLDIDGKTFAKLTGESWNETNYTVTGGAGHINVEYFITEWGSGNGTKGTPHPYQNPSHRCDSAVSPLPAAEPEQEETGQVEETEQDEKAEQQGEAQPKREEAEEAREAAEGTSAERSEDGAEPQSATGQETPSGPGGAQQGVGLGDPVNMADTMAGTIDQPALALVADEMPMLSGGLSLAAVTAVVVAGAAIKRATATASNRVVGRHRKTRRPSRTAGTTTG